MFNSLKYAKQLIEVGFSRQQAETQTQIMTELFETNIAMKDNLEKLQVEMSHRFEVLDTKIDTLGKDLTIRLGIIVATVPPTVLVLISSVIKLLNYFKLV